MINFILLILGIVCAGAGGELFVRGTVGLAQLTRISPAIIGATVAAFATSSPELSVAIGSALAKEPEISLGDALGSNVVNVALILGLALSFTGMKVSRESIRREMALALSLPFLIGIVIIDKIISRTEGFLLLFVFSGWLIALVHEARQNRKSAPPPPPSPRRSLVLINCFVGLALLIAAGRLVVMGAKGLAHSFGVSEFVIGATLVSIGTSIPELATTLIAKWRNQDAMSLGVILGSNIFNGLFIVPLAALICPIPAGRVSTGISLAFGGLAVAFLYHGPSGTLSRGRGVLLLSLYFVFLIALLH